MAHLDSNHTLHVNLSNFHPVSEDLIFEHSFAIQGNTTITYALSDIQADVRPTGIYNVSFDYDAAAGKALYYPAKFDPNERNTSLLPFTAINHTFYQSTSAPSRLSAIVSVVYQKKRSQIKPLSATHIVELYTVAENVVDRNLKVLNSQMFTAGKNSRSDFIGTFVPYLNLETDENIVYPLAFIQGLTAEVVDTSIYLASDPETLRLDETYVNKTLFNPTPALSSIGGQALSGNGFTVQGKSGVTYSGYFSITGAEPHIFSGTTPAGDKRLKKFGTDSEDLSSTNTNIFVPITISEIYSGFVDTNEPIEPRKSYTSVLTSISAGFAHLSEEFDGSEFTSIQIRPFTDPLSGALAFNHTNLMPPDATLQTYVPSASGEVLNPDTSVYSSWENKLPRNLIYSYTTQGYGLSAVNRLVTNPDDFNIVVL